VEDNRRIFCTNRNIDDFPGNFGTF
jgi:hypothetical protein